MLAQLCHASTVSTQWWNATEGNKAALNTSGHAGPQGVSRPNFSPEQAQMRGQTRLLKALSHGGWKPSRLGNGTTFLDSNPAPWLSSLKIKIFLKSSLNKSCFRCCLSHSHQRHHCEELIPIPLIHSYMYWSAVRPIKASSAPIEPVLALWPFLTG